MLSACLVALAAQVFAQASDVLEDPFFGPSPESETRDETAVIQNRKYELGHELALLVGSLPVDPFYKGLTATAGYTLHFNHDWAWEIVQATYSFNLDTNLKKEVLRFEPTARFREIHWVVASHLVFKPIYGKEALFNTDVVHLEGFVQLGPAAVLRTTNPRQAVGGVDFGAGVRLWLTGGVSLRVDLGELVFFDASAQQAFHVHAGVSFNLRGED